MRLNRDYPAEAVWRLNGGGWQWQGRDAVQARAQQGREMADKIKRVVLAFSGGLDTSVILKWLQQTYGCEVVTFTADLGQGEELEPGAAQGRADGRQARAYLHRRSARGIRRATYVFPMMRANALYEGLYLLGTSIARPLIAKRQIEIAREVGADAVSHGATGKGNDQVRFELGYYALAPDIKVIAPWREWDLTSRTALIDFAEKNQIPVPKDKRGESPFSTDANLLHTSSEGKVLEDPWAEVPDYVYSRTDDLVVGAGHARRNHDRIQGAATASRSMARRCRPRRCWPSSTSLASATASAGSTWSRTASSG